MFFFDCHVHIYKNYNLISFFEQIDRNINIVESRYNHEFRELLLLRAYNKNEYSFKEILNIINNEKDFDESPFFLDDEKILSIKYKGRRIFLIDGKQCKTNEKLEVITFNKLYDCESSKGINEILAELINQNEIPIIPWGFGKWTFKRLNILKEILNKEGVYFSNSSNRPSFWPKEIMLKKNNLPGSDPLPINKGYKDVCLFGTAVEASFNKNETIKNLENKVISSKKNKIEIYSNSLRILSDQLKLKLLK